MALHSLYGATVVVVAFGMVTVEPAYAQRRDGNLLPQDQSGQVTAVGCLLKGNAVRGGKADKYVLARPKKGPVESVPEATCTAEPGADALTLDNPEKAKMTDAMLGKASPRNPIVSIENRSLSVCNLLVACRWNATGASA